MSSFKKIGKDLRLPVAAVWLMNSISEYKGKQELCAKQSSQILRALVEMALIESAESSFSLSDSRSNKAIVFGL